MTVSRIAKSLTRAGPVVTRASGLAAYARLLGGGLCLLASLVAGPASAQTWTADNGNGTYSNPLFYDEFSDPDVIRVGSDFYLTGTTMHAMPGLPILHSKDLVNWTLLGYASDRLDLGPEYRLENGTQIYGRGIWAPSFRYHDGTFYIFSNVNGRTTQLFRATDPRGPWTRTAMRRSFHDLSVLFDDDGKVYVVWGYRDIHLAELDHDLTDMVPGTERIIIRGDAGMGEGSHFYRIRGTYYIVSAWYDQRMRMPCARAERPEGPYEVNPAISADEDFGLAQGYRLRAGERPPFAVAPPDPAARGHLAMHQGGIVDTPAGEWWGVSMMDYNSVGRLTMLSPVTWQDGWPYFGLPGNLGRTPRIWVKPQTGAASAPSAPYRRNDAFDRPALASVWQWNHVPANDRWSLTERRGFLRLHSLPAPDFWWARNTLTQRAIGPVSVPTTVVETGGMRPGDVAGLALLNFPYAWIGVRRDANGTAVEQFDQTTGTTVRRPLRVGRVWLRAACDFLTEKARFSYSTDGRRFEALGAEFTMVFQLTTFQGVRYGLFHYNDGGAPGGYADFDGMTVREPHPRGLTRPIPVGRPITLTTAGGGAALAADGDTLRGIRTAGGASPGAAWRFRVVDRGLGRVALGTSTGFVSVDTGGAAGRITVKTGEPAEAETFQWIETPYGDLSLLSLATHRYLRVDVNSGAVGADAPGPAPDRADGATFRWAVERSGAARSTRAGPAPLAPAPPMGWNSWDAYGTAVTESQVKANADVVARQLARYGWRYVVVDIQWYQPSARGHSYEVGARLAMDPYGRLVPAVNKFPSAANGAGFKPLADYVHALGLKFGIHVMRGIPREAVRANLRIKGTPFRAADVADTTNPCAWNPDMWGVDVTRPGGQAYYDALAELYASWGVDFVKADDMGDHRFQPAEIRALRRALDRTGRPIVLSISPGPAPLDSAGFFARHAQLWRISDDFWDEWRLVRAQFDHARAWAPYVGVGSGWPDADMLPFGRLRLTDSAGQGTPSRLTGDEQRTVMTLWSIVRSPLIMGGDLPSLDAPTRDLLTNPEVLAVNQSGHDPRQVLERPWLRVWMSQAGGKDHYLAAFNLDSAARHVDLSWAALGLDAGPRPVRDLWARHALGPADRLRLDLAPHASVLYRVGPR